MIEQISNVGLGTLGAQRINQIIDEQNDNRLGGHSTSEWAGRDKIAVNVSSGNLIIKRQDEFLMGQAAAIHSLRTYNSLGLLNHDSGKAFRLGQTQELVEIQPQKRVILRERDGHERIFNWQVDEERYVNLSNNEANDYLHFEGEAWLLIDGATQNRQRFELIGDSYRLVQETTSEGQTIAYSYDSSTHRLTQIEDIASQHRIRYNYDENGNVRSLTSVSSEGEETLVHYRYEAIPEQAGQYRLRQVVLDLTPADGTVENADGSLQTNQNLPQVFTTSYEYNASNQVIGIKESNGFSANLAYDELGRIQSLVIGEGTQVQRSEYLYSEASADELAYTEVRRYANDVVALTQRVYFNEAKDIVQITLDEQVVLDLTYNVSGQVIRRTDADRLSTQYQYDSNGNVTLEQDGEGNTRTFTYDARNRLVKESRYTVADAELDDSAYLENGELNTEFNDASGQISTVYLYDELDRLRFELATNGEVIEHRYQQIGLEQKHRRVAWVDRTYQETAALFDSLEQPPEPLGIAVVEKIYQELQLWSEDQDHRKSQIVDRYFDRSGQLSRETRYNSVNEDASELAGVSTLHYVYDARGQLLKTVDQRGEGSASTNFSTNYHYDSLGRILTTTDALGNSSDTVYQDDNLQIVTQDVNGLQSTRVFDKLGRTIELKRVGATMMRSTAYAYDALGRQFRVSDLEGVESFHFYDKRDRRVGEISRDGVVKAWVYGQGSKPLSITEFSQRLSSEQWDALTALAAADDFLSSEAVFETLVPESSEADRKQYTLYNAAGEMLLSMDAEGYVSEYQRDGAGRLIAVTYHANPANLNWDGSDKLSIDDFHWERDPETARTTLYQYDAQDRLVQVNDGEGFRTTYHYDFAGQLIQTTKHGTNDAESIHNFQLFNGKGQLVTAIDGEGFRVDYHYDLAGNITRIQRFGNRVSADSLLALTSNPIGFQTAQLQMASGEVPEQIHYYRYDARNQMVEEVNHHGVVTQYHYSQDGKVVAIDRNVISAGINDDSNIESRSELWHYDEFGQLAYEVTALANEMNQAAGFNANDAEAFAIRHTYDTQGNRIKTTDELGRAIHYFYNARGLVEFEVNAIGEVIEYKYNAFDELIETLNYLKPVDLSALPTNAVSTNAAIKLQLTAIGGQQFYQSSSQYDRRGLLVASNDSEYRSQLFNYNAFGDRTFEMTYGGTNTYMLMKEYVYDRRGLLVQQQAKSGEFLPEERFRYDAFGRLVESVDNQGNSRVREYDKRNLLTAEFYNGKRESASEYDAFGRATKLTDANGHSKQVLFDDAARTVTHISPEGLTTIHEFDAFGQSISIFQTHQANPEEKTLLARYTYNAAGEVIEQADALGQTGSYEFDVTGQLIEQDESGVKSTFQYDALGRVLTIAKEKNGIALDEVKTYRYGYSDNQETSPGGLRTITESFQGITTESHINIHGRTVRVIEDPNGAAIMSQYYYDDEGNIIQEQFGRYLNERSEVVKEISYSYDQKNHLREIYSYARNEGRDIYSGRYQYDQLGNLISEVNEQGQRRLYLYDDRQQVSYQIEASTGKVRAFSYDGMGNRVAERVFSDVIQPITLAEEARIDSDQLRTIEEAIQQLEQLASAKVTRYVFDRDNRAAAIIFADGRAEIYDYDKKGNRTQIRYFKDIAVENLSALVAMAELPLLLSSGHEVASSQRLYDNAGRVRLERDTEGFVKQYVFNHNRELATTIHYREPTSVKGFQALKPLLTDSQQTVLSLEGMNGSIDSLRFTDAENHFQIAIDGSGVIRTAEISNSGKARIEKRWGKAFEGDLDALLAMSDIQAIKVAIGLDQHQNAIIESVSMRDGAGREQYKIDQFGNILEQQYDSLNRRVATYTYRVQEHGGDLTNLVQALEDLGEQSLAAHLTENATLTGSWQFRQSKALFSYNHLDLLTHYVDENGFVTRNYYDKRGQLLRIEKFDQAVDSEALSSNFQYYDIDALVSHKGQSIERQYFDLAGRLILTIDADMRATEYQYDAEGRISQQITYHDTTRFDDLDATRENLSAINNALDQAIQSSTIKIQDPVLLAAIESSFSSEENYVSKPLTAEQWEQVKAEFIAGMKQEGEAIVKRLQAALTPEQYRLLGLTIKYSHLSGLQLTLDGQSSGNVEAQREQFFVMRSLSDLYHRTIADGAQVGDTGQIIQSWLDESMRSFLRLAEDQADMDYSLLGVLIPGTEVSAGNIEKAQQLLTEIAIDSGVTNAETRKLALQGLFYLINFMSDTTPDLTEWRLGLNGSRINVDHRDSVDSHLWAWIASEEAVTSISKQEYVYDEVGRLSFLVEQDGRWQSYEYSNKQNNLVRTQYQLALPESVERSVEGIREFLMQQRTPLVATREYTFNDYQDRPVFVIDGAGRVRQNVYDWFGNIEKTVDYHQHLVDNNLKNLSIDELKQRLALSPKAIAANFYDDRNLPRFEVDTAGNLKAFVHGSDGQLSRIINFNKPIQQSDHWRLQQLSLGQLTLSDVEDIFAEMAINPSAHTSEYFLRDEQGQLIAEIDEAGGVKRHLYHSSGELASSYFLERKISHSTLELTENEARQYYVDALTALESQDNASTNQKAYHFYDAKGQLTHFLSAEGWLSSYQYDSQGNLSIEQRYQQQFSDWGNGPVNVDMIKAFIESQTQQPVTSYQIHNRHNQLVIRVDGGGKLKHFHYNALQQLVQTTELETPLVPWPKNEVGEKHFLLGDIANSEKLSQLMYGLGEAEEGQKRVELFVHDTRGELLAKVDAEGYVRGVQRDYLGRELIAIQSTEALALAELLTLDEAQRQQRILTHLAATTSSRHYSLYNTNGQLAYDVDPRGAVIHYAYDESGQLGRTRHFEQFIHLGNIDVVTEGQLEEAVSNLDFEEEIYFYNDQQQLSIHIDNDGKLFQYQYDRFGHLSQSLEFTDFEVPAWLKINGEFGQWQREDFKVLNEFLGSGSTERLEPLWQDMYTTLFAKFGEVGASINESIPSTDLLEEHFLSSFEINGDISDLGFVDRVKKITGLFEYMNDSTSAGDAENQDIFLTFDKLLAKINEARDQVKAEIDALLSEDEQRILAVLWSATNEVAEQASSLGELAEIQFSQGYDSETQTLSRTINGAERNIVIEQLFSGAEEWRVMDYFKGMFSMRYKEVDSGLWSESEEIISISGTGALDQLIDTIFDDVKQKFAINYHTLALDETRYEMRIKPIGPPDLDYASMSRDDLIWESKASMMAGGLLQMMLSESNQQPMGDAELLQALNMNISWEQFMAMVNGEGEDPTGGMGSYPFLKGMSEEALRQLYDSTQGSVYLISAYSFAFMFLQWNQDRPPFSADDSPSSFFNANGYFFMPLDGSTAWRDELNLEVTSFRELRQQLIDIWKSDGFVTQSTQYEWDAEAGEIVEYRLALDDQPEINEFNFSFRFIEDIALDSEKLADLIKDERAQLNQALEARNIYDKKGQVKLQIDNLGRVLQFDYDNAGNRIMEKQYDTTLPSALHLASEGAILDYLRDESITATAKSYLMNDDQQVVLSVDERGHAIYHQYNANGLVIAKYSLLALHEGTTTVSALQAIAEHFETEVLTLSYEQQGHHTQRIERQLYDHSGRLRFAINGELEITETRYLDNQDSIQTIVHDRRFVPAEWQSKLLTTITLANALAAEGTDAPRQWLDNRNLVRVEMDESGFVVMYDYNHDGQLVRELRSKNVMDSNWREFNLEQIRSALEADYVLDPDEYVEKSWYFNQLGQLLWQSDEANNVYRFTYDKSGRLQSTIFQGAYRFSDWSYAAYQRNQNQIGQPISEADYLDWKNNQLQFAKVKSAKHYLSRSFYEESTQKQLDIDAAGEIQVRQFNEDGLLLHEFSVDSSVSFNELAWRSLLSGKLSIEGVLESLSLSSKQVSNWQSYFYDAEDRLEFRVDSLGYVTQHGYNENGKLTSKKQFTESIHASFTEAQARWYLEAGEEILDREQLTLLEDENARESTFGFNSLGQLIEETDGEGEKTTYEYDSRGNLVAKMRSGRHQRYIYDAADRLQISFDGSGLATQYVYDGQGNKIETLRFKQAYNNLDGVSDDIIRQYFIHGFYALNNVEAQEKLDHLYVEAPERKAAMAEFIARLQSNANDQDAVVHERRYFDEQNRLAAVVDAEGYSNLLHYDYDDRLIAEQRFGLRVAFNSRDYGDSSLESLRAAISELPLSAIQGNLSLLDERGLVKYKINPAGQLTENTYNQFGNLVDSKRYDKWVSVGNLQSAISNGNFAEELETLIDDFLSQEENVGSYHYVSRVVYNRSQQAVLKIDESDRVQAFHYDEADRLLHQITLGERFRDNSENWEASAREWLVDLQAIHTAEQRALAGEFETETPDLDYRVEHFIYNQRGELETKIDAMGYLLTYQYDAFGNKTGFFAYEKAWERGESVASTITEYHSDGSYRSQYWLYDQRDQQRIAIDAAGALKETRYNAFGEIVLEAHSQNVVTGLSGTLSLADFTLSSEQLLQARVSEFTYNGSGMVTSMTDALGQREEYAYNDLGKLIEKVDKAGNVWTYQYDELGRLVLESSPLIGVLRLDDNASYEASTDISSQESLLIAYEYDGFGNVITHTKGAGANEARMTRFAYNSLNHLTQRDELLASESSMVNPDAAIESFIRNEDNEWTVARNKLGQISYQIFDDAKQLRFVVDGAGFVNGYEYDLYGNVSAFTRYAKAVDLVGQIGFTSINHEAFVAGAYLATSEEDRQLRFTYDRNNRQVQVDEANLSAVITNQETLAFEASAASQIKVHNATKRVITQYNAFGEQLAQEVQAIVVIDGETRTQSLGLSQALYDKAGRKIAVRDVAGHLTTWQYNANGELIKQREFRASGLSEADFAEFEEASDIQASQFVIDNASDLRETLSQYDSLGRLTLQTIKGDQQHTLRLNGNTAHFDKMNELITSYEYNALGQLAAKVDALGQRTIYESDAIGRVTRQIMAETQLSTLYQHSAELTTEFAYNLFGETVLERKADDTGETVNLYRYNAFGQQIERINGEGDRHLKQYNRLGYLTSEWFQQGTAADKLQMKTYLYDQQNHRVAEIASYRDSIDLSIEEKQATHWSRFNGFGELVGKGTAQGALTVDDIYRETVSGEYVIAAQVYNQYNQRGQVVATNKDGGIERRFQYDVFGRMVSESSYVGATQYFGYDALSRVVTREQFSDLDGDGFVESSRQQFAYDRWNQMIEQVEDDSLRTVYAYDGFGHATLVRKEIRSESPESTTSTFSLFSQERYFYDAVGQAIGVIDARGGKSYSQRNGAGLVLQEGGPERTLYYSYDARGNLVKTTSAKRAAWLRSNNFQAPTSGYHGTEIEHDYDKAGRLISRTQGQESTTYEYDAAGNTLSQRDALNFSVEYAYDGSGNTVWVRDDKTVIDATRRFAYDAFGNKTIETTNAGLVKRWDYQSTDDAYFKNVSRFDNGSASLNASQRLGYQWTEYLYDSHKRLVSEIYRSANDNSNQVSQSRIVGRKDYAYDANGHIKQISQLENLNNGQVHSQTEKTEVFYQYDRNGNRITELQTLKKGDGATETVQDSILEYDELNRLVLVADKAPRALLQTRYVYDAAGNRTLIEQHKIVMQADGTIELGEKVKSHSYTFDSASRVAHSSDGNVTAGFDQDGKRVRNKVVGERGFRNYSDHFYYNSEGRLAKIKRGSADGKNTKDFITYEYDAAGRLTREIHHAHVDHVAKTLTYQYTMSGSERIETVTEAGQWGEAWKTQTISRYNAENQLIERKTKEMAVDRRYLYDRVYFHGGAHYDWSVKMADVAGELVMTVGNMGTLLLMDKHPQTGALRKIYRSGLDTVKAAVWKINRRDSDNNYIAYYGAIKLKTDGSLWMRFWRAGTDPFGDGSSDYHDGDAGWVRQKPEEKFTDFSVMQDGNSFFINATDIEHDVHEYDDSFADYDWEWIGRRENQPELLVKSRYDTAYYQSKTITVHSSYWIDMDQSINISVPKKPDVIKMDNANAIGYMIDGKLTAHTYNGDNEITATTTIDNVSNFEIINKKIFFVQNNQLKVRNIGSNHTAVVLDEVSGFVKDDDEIIAVSRGNLLVASAYSLYSGADLGHSWRVQKQGVSGIIASKGGQHLFKRPVYLSAGSANVTTQTFDYVQGDKSDLIKVTQHYKSTRKEDSNTANYHYDSLGRLSRVANDRYLRLSTDDYDHDLYGRIIKREESGQVTHMFYANDQKIGSKTETQDWHSQLETDRKAYGRIYYPAKKEWAQDRNFNDGQIKTMINQLVGDLKNLSAPMLEKVETQLATQGIHLQVESRGGSKSRGDLNLKKDTQRVYFTGGSLENYFIDTVYVQLSIMMQRQYEIWERDNHYVGSSNFQISFNPITNSSVDDEYDIPDYFEALSARAGTNITQAYHVNGGETLMTIARQLWGDANLWYILAEANNLNVSDTLFQGQVLNVPEVMSQHNNVSTFVPYNPGVEAGNVSPQTRIGNPLRPTVWIPPLPPVPKKSLFEKVAMGIVIAFAIVAAIAVSLLTMGAAAAVFGSSYAVLIAAAGVGSGLASITSQGIFVAAGMQDKIDWGRVGIDAGLGVLSAGLGTALGSAAGASRTGMMAISAITGAVDGLLGEAVYSSISDKPFNWTNAAIGMFAGAGMGVGMTRMQLDGVRRAAQLAAAKKQLADAAANSALMGQAAKVNAIARTGLPDSVLASQMSRARANLFAKQTRAEKALRNAHVSNADKFANPNPEACFVAGTWVHTKNGLKVIEDIVIGDWVLSQPEASGEQAYRRVLETYAYQDKAVLTLTIKGASGKTETIQTTPNHLIAEAGGSWLEASKLTPNHSLVQANGDLARIISVENNAQRTNVYNFAVDGFHTYYVSQLGIWVHNDCGWLAKAGSHFEQPGRVWGTWRGNRVSMNDELVVNQNNSFTTGGGFLGQRVTYVHARVKGGQQSGFIRSDNLIDAKRMTGTQEYNRLVQIRNVRYARQQAALQRVEAKTGIPVEHLKKFQMVADREDAVISVRDVGPLSTSLIRENQATKGFHVKAKTSGWGPTAGFVSSDPKFTKPKSYNTRGRLKQKKLVDKALAHRDQHGRRQIGETQLQLTDARRLELQNGIVMQPGQAPVPLITRDPNNPGNINRMNYISRDPDGRTHHFVFERVVNAPGAGGQQTWKVYYGPGEKPWVPLASTAPPDLTAPLVPVKVLTDLNQPQNFKAGLTGDYDLWAVFPRASEYDATPNGLDRRPVAESHRRVASMATYDRFEDPDLGNITPRTRRIKDDLNDRFREDGYEGGNLVHHSSEEGRPGVDEIDLDFVAFIPGRDLPVVVSNKQELHTFYRNVFPKYQITLNPGWGPDLGFTASNGGNWVSNDW